MCRGAWGATVHGITKSGMTKRLRPESKELDLSGCSGEVLPGITEFPLLVSPDNPPPGSFLARATVL